MPLEQPKNLVSAAEMQIVEAYKALNKPKHSEFSRYFPRVRGTPSKSYGRKRARATDYDDVVKGMHNFVDWADKAVSAQKTTLNSRNLKPVMHGLFGLFCKLTGVRGRERDSMRIALDTFLVGVKNEYLEFEKETPLVITKKEWTTKSFGRNQLCPCGSEKKYKRCHIGDLLS